MICKLFIFWSYSLVFVVVFCVFFVVFVLYVFFKKSLCPINYRFSVLLFCFSVKAGFICACACVTTQELWLH